MSAQRRQAKLHPGPKNLIDLRLSDEARFIKSWLENPLLAGAITPSGRFLARAMAQCVDPDRPGPIVELGPGTGPVTQALLARGVAPDRLVLVEFEPSFCLLLRKKFPHVKVVQGDAYRLADTLGPVLDAAPAAVVSSLPLLTKPEHIRLSLLRQAFALMGAEGRFIQFTYGVKSPVPSHLAARDHFATQSLAPIWLNLPPARIFVYRHVDCPHAVESKPDVIDKLLSGSRRFGREIRDELEEARARLSANHAKHARVKHPARLETTRRG
ncbi:class I SAM-dependent methyltransferase [Rhodoblastus sp.]|uniref:class I SAM-dependent methyltransferase n=1 Tax=Rhodoblastus sp. TaxID=1962975 RepID=UPI0035AF5E4B